MQEYTPPPNGFRTFLIVWVTQSISVFGSALTYFALNIWVLNTLYPLPEQKAQLAFALSAMGLAFSIPTVFVGPIAGAWADRHDRKQIMMLADFISGILSTALAFMVLTNTLTLPILLILDILFAAVGAFHSAAFDTSYSMMVPKEQLPRANGLMQTIWALSGVLSPAIAATIIAIPALARQNAMAFFSQGTLAALKDGTPLAMGIDAVTFFLAAITLIFLYIPSPIHFTQANAAAPKKSVWSDIKDGALYIWHRRPMMWLLGTFTVANFVASPIGVMLALLIKFNLAADWQSRGFTLESTLALLTTAGSIGGVVGGVLISSWGGLKKRRIYGVIIPVLMAGLAIILVGYSSWVYLTALGMFIMDGLTPFMNAHSQAIWQTQTPLELQGRVFSVRRVVAQFSWPLSTALAGWLGAAFDPGHVVVVLGILLSVFCVGQLFNPYLLRVEDKAYLDALAARAAGN